ncbi:hypothetical protein SLS53_008722 [Cytospora paraplurivora]|uniref:Uncharacterized protein n=1 Tax=Cytospora paraplurivora TaxID=2898453 RepID=A0AAN9YBV0_9PEZI
MTSDDGNGNDDNGDDNLTPLSYEPFAIWVRGMMGRHKLEAILNHAWSSQWQEYRYQDEIRIIAIAFPDAVLCRIASYLYFADYLGRSGRTLCICDYFG